MPWLRSKHQIDLYMLTLRYEAKTLIGISPLVFSRISVIFNPVEIAYQLMNVSRTWPIPVSVVLAPGDATNRRQGISPNPTKYYTNVFIEPVTKCLGEYVTTETAYSKFHCVFFSCQSCCDLLGISSSYAQASVDLRWSKSRIAEISLPFE